MGNWKQIKYYGSSLLVKPNYLGVMIHTCNSSTLQVGIGGARGYT